MPLLLRRRQPLILQLLLILRQPFLRLQLLLLRQHPPLRFPAGSKSPVSSG